MTGVVVALVLLAACDNRDATPDWSRMITQPKLQPFGAAAAFADGAAMRPVPIGTIARETVADHAPPNGELPIAITRAVLERGRDRFEIVCAACHGIAGDGDSAVARNMQRRRPPSLHETRIIALTPAAMYRVIALGYGLMPSYASMLGTADRWAVVAYVRTLELSWRADLDALPNAIRTAVAQRLP